MLSPKMTGAKHFCALNERMNAQEFEHVLLHDGAELAFAYEIHELIISLLSLPAYGAVFGFHYASKGEFPIAAERFART